ncbi:phage tail protein [Kluyvera ascorbata]|uniref:phage tail protein n=1 Tax=Kluyvera ascorbata TaxID=51288 RepID=UPI0034D58CB5
MTTKYFATLTNQGAARLANATALGLKLNITQMGVGDANGTLPTPSPTQTTLINQRRIAAINSLSVDDNDAGQIIVEQVIPENEGGFWIREIGLYDDTGVLIAVANCPETYKPLLTEGSGRTQTIRMILVVSSSASITLKVDPSVVLATRKYVDDGVIEVKSYVDKQVKAHEAKANPHSQYLLIKNALKEIADAGLTDEVLENLGLGGAAKLNVGAVTGTVAAGDDSRIVNAVQPSNPAICTAWVNFSGANNSATIRASYNVSSVTRLSAGKYQINFGTPMNNANYAPALTIGDSSSSGSASAVVTLNGSTTGDPVKKDADGIHITTRGSSGPFDYSEINAFFFGGK